MTLDDLLENHWYSLASALHLRGLAKSTDPGQLKIEIRERDELVGAPGSKSVTVGPKGQYMTVLAQRAPRRGGSKVHGEKEVVYVAR